MGSNKTFPLKLNNNTLFEFLIMFGQPYSFFRGQIRISRCFLPLYIYMCFCESFQEKRRMQKVAFFLCDAKKYRHRADSNSRPSELTVRLLATWPLFFTDY